MHNETPRVLIVDDEETICELLRDELSEDGCRCTIALNADDALFELDKREFDIALLDIKLPGISGMDLLQKMRIIRKDFPVIMITAINDVDTAVEAMTLGAIDYVVKPLDMDRVRAGISIGLWEKQVKALKKMDAIARNLEVELCPGCVFSAEVNRKTIEAAQYLGIPTKEIQHWSETRFRPG